MRQPHTVQVQVRQNVKTPHGTARQEVGPRVDYVCRFRSVGTSELDQGGVVVTYNAFLLSTTPWPGGMFDEASQVIHKGKVYDMAGIPVERDGSPRTAHVQVNLSYVGVDRG